LLLVVANEAEGKAAEGAGVRFLVAVSGAAVAEILEFKDGFVAVAGDAGDPTEAMGGLVDHDPGLEFDRFVARYAPDGQDHVATFFDREAETTVVEVGVPIHPAFFVGEGAPNLLDRRVDDDFGVQAGHRASRRINGTGTIAAGAGQ
jgi:hypothetical protein